MKIELNLNETEVATLQRILHKVKSGKLRAITKYGFPYLCDDVKLLEKLLPTLMGNESEPIEEQSVIKTKCLDQFSLRDLIKRRRALQRAIARSQSGQIQPPTQQKLDYWTKELRDVITEIQKRYVEATKSRSK